MAAAKEARVPDSIRYAYRFGPFHLDPERRTLTRSGRAVELPSKIFDTLVVLVESGGQPLENTLLMARVYPGSPVEEKLIHFNVTQAIVALGEGYIEALAPRGYRFIGDIERIEIRTPVERRAQRRGPVFVRWLWAVVAAGCLAMVVIAIRWIPESASRPAKPAVAAPAPVRVVALAPFRSSHPDAVVDAIGAIVPRGLRDRLQGMAGVQFLALRLGHRFDPLAEGRAVNADAVFDGTLEAAADSVRVATQLRRTTDGAPLYTGSLEIPATEIGTLEARLAQQAARALGKDSARESRAPAVNAEAYRRYAAAQYAREFESTAAIPAAIEQLEEAVELDAEFAAAHAALASARVAAALLLLVDPDDVMADAREAAERALELDPKLPAAALAAAESALYVDWDRGRAAERLARAGEDTAAAIRLKAALLNIEGSFEAAAGQLKRALDLPSQRAETHAALASTYLYAGNWDQAITESRKALEMEPDLRPALSTLAEALRQAGQDRESFEQYLAIDRSSGAREATLESMRAAFQSGGFESYWRRRAGLRTPNDPAGMVLTLAAAGRPDRALRWMDHAAEVHAPQILFLPLMPGADQLRSVAGKDGEKIRGLFARLPSRRQP